MPLTLTRRNFLAFTAGAAGVVMAPGASGLFAAELDAPAKLARLGSATVVHFSPTGTSAAISTHLGKALAGQINEIDLTSQTLKAHSIDRRSFAVIAVPSYYGRVPARAAEALRLLKGNGTPCVSLVVYGNRAFEDTLVELNDILTEQGFYVIASGAFVAQHAIIEEVATGRPDAADLAALDAFAAGVLAEVGSGQLSGPPKVPGNRPYRDIPPASGLTPVVADSCIDCGLCAETCPVAAIPVDNFRTTEREKCILCMRCVRICPHNARALPPPAREKLLAHMLQFSARQEPESYM